jgi:hypothetical protein
MQKNYWKNFENTTLLDWHNIRFSAIEGKLNALNTTLSNKKKFRPHNPAQLEKIEILLT